MNASITAAKRVGVGVGVGGRIALILLLGWVVPARAQSRSLSIRPAIVFPDSGSAAFGARWEGALEPAERTTLAAAFPRELWWAARGQGAWVSRAGAVTEPLIDGEAEFGMQVLLLRQRPCLPDNCPEDLVDFDLGYVALVARAQTEMDRSVDEAVVAVGGALLYRPQFNWSAQGVGFLVPTLSLGVGAAWPVKSALRDSLDVDKASYVRFDLELDWALRLERERVPSALRPLRLDAHYAYYTHGNVEDAIVSAIGRRGDFMAVDLGYELTGRVPYVRHVFIRWSQGEHATLPVSRKAWLIGITLGPTR